MARAPAACQVIAEGVANTGAGYFFMVETGLPASAFYYILVESESDAHAVRIGVRFREPWIRAGVRAGVAIRRQFLFSAPHHRIVIAACPTLAA